MAKHVDITGWDKEKIGTAYMDLKVANDLAERRLNSMTLADGTVPETRLGNNANEIRDLTRDLKKLKQDFKNFKAITFTHMDWMSTDIKWKEDQLIESHTKPSGDLRRRDNEGYSKELTAVLEFVKKLKEE
jgi:hypothetical protein